MKKSRYTVSIPAELDEVVQNLSDKSKVPAATILRGLIMLQHTELNAFNQWFSALEDGSNQFHRGVHTLENPGPNTLMEDAAVIEHQNGNKLLFGVEALKHGNSIVAVIQKEESQ